MHSVLLAAWACSALPLDVQPQEFMRDASWPSHAVVTLPRGWLKEGETLTLLEDGQPTIAQAEVAARWPDESPKYVHVYTSFRYAGGKPAKYEIVKHAEAAKPPASPLKVTDNPDGIQIETGELSLVHSPAVRRRHQNSAAWQDAFSTVLAARAWSTIAASRGAPSTTMRPKLSSNSRDRHR